MKKFAHMLLLLASTSSFTCSSPDGEGTVVVTAYGESFIEEGIPSSEMDDGWQIEFERFEIAIENVVVGGETLAQIESIDLTKGSSGDGHEIGALAVAEGDHTHSSYAITRVDVEGRGTKGDESKTFHWLFHRTTTYHDCETTTSVKDGGSSTFQITVHADHLFYDSLVSTEPNLLFDSLAEADDNGDGEITEGELSSADIGAYDPGSEDGIDDLWAFLNAQAKTLGHVDGEGHCHIGAVD